MSGEPEQVYSNIREILEAIIGQKLVDVTQQDRDEFQETKQSYVMLMFENGCFVKFFVGDDGFEHNCGEDEDDDT